MDVVSNESLIVGRYVKHDVLSNRPVFKQQNGLYYLYYRESASKWYFSKDLSGKANSHYHESQAYCPSTEIMGGVWFDWTGGWTEEPSTIIKGCFLLHIVSLTEIREEN